MTSKTGTRFVALAYFAVVIAICYLKVVAGPFQFDDLDGLLLDRRFTSTNFADLFHISPTRLLTSLSLAWNYQAGGWQPFGFHLVNILLHVANTYMVFELCQLILRAQNIRQQALPISVLAALTFGLHPLQTGAVSYIWQRSTCLATFFYLLSLVTFIKFRERDSKVYLFFAVTFTCFGMVSKQICFTIPIAMLLLEWLVLRWNTRPKISGAKWLILLLPLALIPVMQAVFGDKDLSEITVDGHVSGTPLHYFLTQQIVIFRYLWLVVWPAKQNLDYDIAASTGLELATSTALLGHFFLLALAWHVRSRLPLVTWIILFFYLALSVESSFIPIKDMMFEHRMYLPMVPLAIGFALLCGWLISSKQFTGAQRLLARPLFVFLLCTAIVLPWMLLTSARNNLWMSSIALWEDTATKSPHKARPQANLGAAYFEAGDFARAAQQFQIASAIDRSIKTISSLALAHIYNSSPTLAEPLIAEALARNSNFYLAHLGAAELARVHGDTIKRRYHLAQAAELAPQSALVQNALNAVDD